MNNVMECWLRCNKCYRSMKKSTRTFSLTQCQHVFCSTCIVEAEKRCPECESVGVKTVPLVKPLPQPLQHYFGRVGSLLQQSFEASQFQRTQMFIALRRFDEIQGKYEDMKRTYYQSAQQMKSLAVAYAQKKEKYAKIAAEIDQLRSVESRESVAGAMRPNFMPSSTNHRDQQNQRIMDYMTASSRPCMNPSRNDSVPSSLNSSRSSIVTPFLEQRSRHLLQNHLGQSAYQNRSKQDVPEYCYRSVAPRGDLQYPPRAIFSNTQPSENYARHLGASWAARNVTPGSLGDSSSLSSAGGTMRDQQMVNNNYPSYRRS